MDMLLIRLFSAILALVIAGELFAISRLKKRGNRGTRTYAFAFPALLLGASLSSALGIVIAAAVIAIALAATIIVLVVKKDKELAAKEAAEAADKNEEQTPEEPVKDAEEQTTDNAENGQTTQEELPTEESKTSEDVAPAEETANVEDVATEEPVNAVDEAQEEEPAPADEVAPTEDKEEAQEETENAEEDTVQESVSEPLEEPAPVEKDEDGAATADVTGEEEAVDEASASDEDRYIAVEDTDENSGKAYDTANKRYVFVRYDKSFKARLIQADDVTKAYYDSLKNELLAYGAKSRISWRHENFRVGRARVAKLQFRGKSICIYLPLDPNAYKDSKYKIEDVSDVQKNEDVPCAYWIKNDRRSRYANDLIAEVMTKLGLEKKEKEPTAFSGEYPYEDTEALIKKKLIKIISVYEDGDETAAEVVYQSAPAFKPIEVKQEVKATEVSTLMLDEDAEAHIVLGERVMDRTKSGIVNVDDLSRNFAPGEKVTLDKIKQRIKSVGKNVTYIKVLARGTLDKPLIVEADDYSIDAVKMILLTGGDVIRTKRSN